jgi:Carboxypeptidase regulatory-like domain
VLDQQCVVCGLVRFALRLLCAAVLLMAGFALATSAQQATIVGTVTDPSGAVMAGVNIIVTNPQTGWTRTIASNEAGQYVVPDIQIGKYYLKAEAPGFKTAEQKDVVLQVGDRLRVDFQMKVGMASETVTVESNPIAVQADSGEVSNVITDRQMSQIAVNGRSIYQLAALTPGASSQIGAGGMLAGVANTPVGGDAGVEFNGMRQNHNIYLLDGGENDDRGGAGGMSIAPSSDAIAEFRALTSNYSADYGLSSAGTMTMILKSGTSTLHASAWEFNRNDALDARNFFNPAPAKVAKLRLNVFGFNVGGPVTLGKLYNPDKKKTFFFYNMEWRRQIQGGLTNQHVPDPASYGGDFSTSQSVITVPKQSQVSPNVLFANCPGGVAPAGVAQGQPFPGNKIPSCMISPNSAALLAAGIFPAPTTVDAQGNATFIGGADSPTNLREEVVRIDHNFNSKLSVFGHFLAEQITQTFGLSQWSSDNVPTVGDTFGNPSYSAVVHTTYTISPTLLNEIAFNYNGNRISIVPRAQLGLTSLALPSGYDSTSSRLFTGPNNLNRIPDIDLGGSTGTKFEIANWPWQNKADDYQIRDDLSWTKGSHQLKFGGSWAIYKKVQDLFGRTQGTFNFDGTYTGNDFADFLLGDAKTYGELAVQDHGYWNNVSWAAYVQDNWRATRRLTLNLGLRWDGVPHTYEANNRMGNFYPSLYNPAAAATFNSNGTICAGASDPGCTAPSPGLGTSPNPILAGVPLYLNGIGIPGKNGVPKSLVDNQWAAFGPRIGFAYDFLGDSKTVLRGGFGIMYERIQGNDMYNAGPNIPFSLNVGLNSVEMVNPSLALATGTAAARPINPADIIGLAVDNNKLPTSYQYSLGIQRALSAKTVLSVTYVGNQNRHQNDYRQINLPDQSYLPNLVAGASYATAPGLPYPGFRSINLTNNEANSHYNGLQLDLNSQLGKDLFLRAFYTYSKAIDPTNAGNGGGDLGNVSNPYLGWRYDEGPSGYDRTHNAVVNFIYDIPLFRHNSSKLVKGFLGGWQTSGIVTLESGVPINVTVGGPLGNLGLPNATNRPNISGSVSAPSTVASWFNNTPVYAPNPVTGASTLVAVGPFSPPAVGTFGNLGRNALRGPGRDNWNLSLFKNFSINEARGTRFELRLETFNTWNRTQFNAISTTLSYSFNKDFNAYLPNPGQNFGQVTSAFDPKIIQLGAKLYF